MLRRYAIWWQVLGMQTELEQLSDDVERTRQGKGGVDSLERMIRNIGTMIHTVSEHRASFDRIPTTHPVPQEAIETAERSQDRIKRFYDGLEEYRASHRGKLINDPQGRHVAALGDSILTNLRELFDLYEDLIWAMEEHNVDAEGTSGNSHIARTPDEIRQYLGKL